MESERTYTVIEHRPGEADVIIHGTWSEENQQFAVDFAANLAQDYNNQERTQNEEQKAGNADLPPEEQVDPGEPVVIEPATAPPEVQPPPIWYAATPDHNCKIYVRETSADLHPVDTAHDPGDVVHDTTGHDAEGAPTGTGDPVAGPVDAPTAEETVVDKPVAEEPVAATEAVNEGSPAVGGEGLAAGETAPTA